MSSLFRRKKIQETTTPKVAIISYLTQLSFVPTRILVMTSRVLFIMPESIERNLFARFLEFSSRLFTCGKTFERAVVDD